MIKTKYNQSRGLTYSLFNFYYMGCLGRDGMVVGFTTTYASSAYHH